MRVLVACEESQEVCKAFRALGHEAYSCDIEPCSGGHPEWHIQVDALELLKMRWDMILAFPPCTYLSNAGAKHLFRGGELMPTLTPQNEWVSVEERLPELPEKDWCSKMVISCDKNGHVAPMIWERAQVRGKMIERWKYHWDRIYDGAGITHWMPLPAPPGEGNNVPNEAPNEPLTLEQLREMDGQPVWDSSLRCWGIVKSEKDGDVFLQTKSGEFGLDPLGRVKVYRRPPEVSP